MTEQQYQHEVIVPDKGFPFKLFLFEGHSGKYIREKHWHRSIEIFAVQEGELDFILDTTHYHLGEGEFIIVNSNEVHAIHANRPNHTIVLQIPLNQFASYFTGEQFIWFSHSERTYDEQVACLIFRMYKVYRMQTDGYDFEILSMFYQLLHILVKKYRKLDVQDELLKSNQQLNRLGMLHPISRIIIWKIFRLENWREYLDIRRLICQKCLHAMRASIIRIICKISGWNMR